YRAFTKLAKEKVFQEDGKGLLAFTYLTKLRQLALMPEWLVKNYAGQNSKLEVLVNLIKEAEGKKILVFSQFTKVLGHIGERLQQEGIGYSYLDGSTEAKKRLELVDQFNETDDHQVFLISLKAGGTGLNLTSASMVIHFDPWWNPAVQDQATDRAHRIGQSQVVNVISLIAKGTVEERIVELQESKKELIEAVMEQGLNNEGLLKKLTTEELVSLFEII
ncbi:MAG: helicase-related protein, partial [Niameybacter sp.]